MKDEAIEALRGYERRCRELEAGASARDAHIAALEARLQVRLGGVHWVVAALGRTGLRLRELFAVPARIWEGTLWVQVAPQLSHIV